MPATRAVTDQSNLRNPSTYRRIPVRDHLRSGRDQRAGQHVLSVRSERTRTRAEDNETDTRMAKMKNQYTYERKPWDKTSDVYDSANPSATT
jgi:hypothetical protein